MTEHKWSPAEKAAARRTFDLALTRQFDDITKEVKHQAAAIKSKAALRDLEDYLTASRKEIDRKYDYRYSVLCEVFAYLIREGRLSLDELQGLGEDKVKYIRGIVRT